MSEEMSDVHVDMFNFYVDMKAMAFAEAAQVPFMVNYMKSDNQMVTVAMPDRGDFESALARLLVEFGPPEWISVMFDVWIGDQPAQHRGDFEKAFESGDMTIKEALVMVIADSVDDIHGAQIDYRVDSNGELVFEPCQEGWSMDGSIVRSLRMVMAFRGLSLDDIMLKMANDIIRDFN